MHPFVNRVRRSAYLVSFSLFVLLSCEKKEVPSTSTTVPSSTTAPTSTTPITTTAVSTTPITTSAVSTTPVSSTPTSATPISTTPITTTVISTTTVTPPVTTPPVTQPPTNPPPTPTPTPTPVYSNGSESPLLTLGNLTGATTNPDNATNFLLLKDQYVVSYNKSRGHASWVAWHLQKSDLGSAKRQDDFRPDATLPMGWYQVRPSDYASVDGFDRGHLCPSGDRTDTEANNSATFLMTNMIPQAPSLNRGFWAELEATCRELVLQGNELYIYSGAYGTTGTGSNGPKSILVSGKVTVPARIWKVIVVLPQGENDLSRVNTQTTVISVDVPNSELTANKTWDDYLVAPYSIELASGATFFSTVSSSIRSILRVTTYKPASTTPPTTTPTPTPAPTGDTPCGTYNSKQLYKGPQGGCYYINSNGNKTYVDRSYCNC